MARPVTISTLLGPPAAPARRRWIAAFTTTGDDEPTVIDLSPAGAAAAPRALPPPIPAPRLRMPSAPALAAFDDQHLLVTDRVAPLPAPWSRTRFAAVIAGVVLAIVAGVAIEAADNPVPAGAHPASAAGAMTAVEAPHVISIRATRAPRDPAADHAVAASEPQRAAAAADVDVEHLVTRPPQLELAVTRVQPATRSAVRKRPRRRRPVTVDAATPLGGLRPQ